MKFRNKFIAKRIGTKTLASLLAYGMALGSPMAVFADDGETAVVAENTVQAKKTDGSEVFVSVSDYVRSIFKYLPAGPQFYDEDTVTDQPMRQIAAELIREKALRMLDDEIPHGIAVVIDQMKERPNGIIDVDATIVCERDSHKGIIIGKGGSMLKRIGTAARMEIENLMDTKVNLKLWVKVRREWRDSDMYMKNYGYNPKEI